MKSAIATTSNQPDRSLPAGMAELLRLALEAGLDFVELGFESLDYDFAAPIGWILHLSRVDPMLIDGPAGSPESRANHLTVTAQVGSQVNAYVGPINSEDPYLNEAQIAAWIQEPRAGIPEYTAEDRAALAGETKRFLDALANGWSASREIRRHDRVMMNKHFEANNPDMVTVFKFSAPNWFYNIEGHPGNRENGTSTSLNLTVVSSKITAPIPYYCGIDGVRSDAQTILGKIASPQPWFAPVAYCTEETESEDSEWVL